MLPNRSMFVQRADIARVAEDDLFNRILRIRSLFGFIRLHLLRAAILLVLLTAVLIKFGIKMDPFEAIHPSNAKRNRPVEPDDAEITLSKPLNEASIRLINSIINSRVPEEKFYRDMEEE